MVARGPLRIPPNSSETPLGPLPEDGHEWPGQAMWLLPLGVQFVETYTAGIVLSTRNERRRNQTLQRNVLFIATQSFCLAVQAFCPMVSFTQ